MLRHLLLSTWHMKMFDFAKVGINNQLEQELI